MRLLIRFILGLFILLLLFIGLQKILTSRQSVLELVVQFRRLVPSLRQT